MFKRFLIHKFNKKYAQKELLFCERIYEDIAFMPFHVNKCCHCSKMPYSPPALFQRILTEFSFLEYLKKLDIIMDLNQKTVNYCFGCKFLKKQIVPKLPKENQIKFFTINHFTKCNSNCVYCAIGRKTEDIKYNLLPIIKN